MTYDIQNIVKNVPDWIENGFKTKEDMDQIETFGKYIAGKMNKRDKSITTSQIRIAYGEISRLKMRFDDTSLSDLMMLRAKIAYAAAREGGDTYRNLQKVITKGIDCASASQDINNAFKNLAHLFEAILAYHKAYGGK